MPGRLISKEYLAVPVALTGPSMRSVRLPMSDRFAAAGHSTFAMRHLRYRLVPAGLFYQTWSPFIVVGTERIAGSQLTSFPIQHSGPVQKFWLIRSSFRTVWLWLQAFFLIFNIRGIRGVYGFTS